MDLVYGFRISGKHKIQTNKETDFMTLSFCPGYEVTQLNCS